ADRVAAVERPLRPAQDLDALDVVQLLAELLLVRLRHAVDDDRHRRIGIVDLRDAADLQKRVAERERAVHRHVRRQVDEVGARFDAGLGDLPRTERRERHRHVLQPLLAVLGGHDDFLDLLGLGSGSAAACEHRQEERRCGAGISPRFHSRLLPRAQGRRRPPSSGCSISMGWKSSSMPKARGPNVASACSLRMTGAELVPMTLTLWPYLSASVVMGRPVSRSMTLTRSGTIATVRPFRRATRFSFWKSTVISSLPPSSRAILRRPMLKPRSVLRSMSVILPSNSSLLCR